MDKTEVGPIYGVPLIDSLPIGGGIMQAMPTTNDLKRVMKVCVRAVAGYEVLLGHYREALNEIERLKARIAEMVEESNDAAIERDLNDA